MQSIDEQIHLAEYDPSWPIVFETERNRIATALVTTIGRFEHIGSTAVPGLIAKPTVDIMLGSDTWPPPKDVGESIVGLGYDSLGEAGVPERLYFRLRSPNSVNLHVVRFNGGHWRSNIVLREYLRRNSGARNRYANAKRTAFSCGAKSLLVYSDAKAPMVATLLAEALEQQNVS